MSESQIHTLEVAELLKFYKDMLLIRRFEEKAGQLYGMGKIGGFCHLYIGQEGVSVGIQHALKKQDSVISGYRNHAHLIMKGADPGRIMAELLGREEGYGQGKGGSMHMFAPEIRFFGGQAMTGSQAPLGTGIAFAHQYRADDGICVVYLGDGAINTGQVFESFHMASHWALPVLFVIENNGTGMESPPATTVCRRDCNLGAAYGIQGMQVDGADVVSVHNTAIEATANVRGGSPLIMEVVTARYRGHANPSPSNDKGRQFKPEDHDPIERLRARLTDSGQVDETVIKEIDKEIRDKVNRLARAAQESSEPDPKALTAHVLAGI